MFRGYARSSSLAYQQASLQLTHDSSNSMIPTNTISQERYLFTESLAFILPEDNKVEYIVKEIIRSLPVTSIFASGAKFIDCYEKRKFTEENIQKSYVFDVRFSVLSLVKHAVNALGLAILILPLRIIATCMREYDLAHNWKCENPHFLHWSQIQICNMIYINQKTHYEGLLELCPGEDDYAKRMAFRDHIQYPEYLYKSVYKDPFEKTEDLKIKKKLTETRKKLALEAWEKKHTPLIKELNVIKHTTKRKFTRYICNSSNP